MNTKTLFVNGDYKAPEAFLRKYAQHKLSPNTQNWPIEILKVLGEDYPWVTEGVRPATVDMEEVKKDEGTGYGTVVVWQKGANEVPKGYGQQPTPTGPSILLPFVVRQFEMSPLDIFITGKKVLPLTQKRVREAFLGSNIFTGVDKSLMKSDGLLSQLAPPPEAFYSRFGRTSYPSELGEGGRSVYSSAGANKEAGAISTQDSYILNQLLPTISKDELRRFSDVVYRDPNTLAQFVRNSNVDILQKIVKTKPLTASDFKNVARAIPKNVHLFQKLSPGQWKVTSYNDRYMSPDHVCANELDLLKKFSGMPEVAKKIAAGKGFILTVNHDEVKPVMWHTEMTPETEPVSSTGVHYVVHANKSIEKMFCWKGFLDYELDPVDYVLAYDGDCYAVQDVVQGEKLDEDWKFEEGTLKPGIWGTFLVKNEDGEQEPVMPFKILAIYREDRYQNRVFIRATDMFGHEANFIVMPPPPPAPKPVKGDLAIASPYNRPPEKWHNATGVLSPDLADQLGARSYIVPGDTQFITLGSQSVALAENAKTVKDAFRVTAMANFSSFRDKTRPTTTVAVACTDKAGGTYRIEGNCLELLLSSNVADVDTLKAKWALVMLGLSVEDAQKALNLAEQYHQVFVMNVRPPKAEVNIKIDPQSEEILKISAALRKDLLKEAAYIKDKKSVDALLALNLVSPENLMVFLKNMDKFEEVEQDLAKLLLMCRFGLEAVPETAVANCLKNLTLVNESLEMLQGVLGKQMSAEGAIEFGDNEEQAQTMSNVVE
jgi:hypothetical protein